jgi:hypothetical protein
MSLRIAINRQFSELIDPETTMKGSLSALIIFNSTIQINEVTFEINWPSSSVCHM